MDESSSFGPQDQELFKYLKRYKSISYTEPFVEDKTYDFQHTVSHYVLKELNVNSSTRRFYKLYTEPLLTLVLFEELLEGFFIFSNDLHYFPTLNKLQTPPFGDEYTEDRCRVIKLPNRIPPHMMKYVLNFPRYIRNVDVKKWDDNFKQFLYEIDPSVEEICGASGNIVANVISNDDIMECKKCKIGFINRKNNEHACVFHTGKSTHSDTVQRVWDCCGKEQSSRGCREGFHVSCTL